MKFLRREFFKKAAAGIAAIVGLPAVALPKPQGRWPGPGDVFVPPHLRDYLIRFRNVPDCTEINEFGQTVTRYGIVAEFGPETSFEAAAKLLVDKLPVTQSGFRRECVNMEFYRCFWRENRQQDYRLVNEMFWEAKDIEIDDPAPAPAPARSVPWPYPEFFNLNVAT